ncbi:hypothetical protein EXU85_13485 [Spirosoma sp. KCTC 42546]|uniref:HD domain-containing protein n=1 Tax=Spirosoma sp. KCTC 42546 TaxID=2520506 RepID=UPI0011586B25|nr:ATP-binding protein [Spirosoma sp. KCTC 42546]QDK79560.1 hypothetical protein EXU85_13485 [Spirosoma sp. KCTC 42546]
MQISIKIPDFLLEKLKRSVYNKLVEDVLSNYVDWIARNETVFFREYTDHGIDHLEGVLETSVSLLTDKSKNIFSDSDACLLVISTILHDVALHIHEDQFIILVSKGSYTNHIKELDSETWHTLWIKYAAEASRFSQSQLQLYFGVSETIPIPDLKSPQSWNPLQYQLIGEFLRRNHPRLAHDFAVFGFPAVENGSNIFIKPDDGKFKKFIDLAGLVARSHGTSLRGLFDYIKNTFGHLRDQEGSHAIYIMTVLRIADFLQLQSSRAPKGQMIVKNLKSPLSRREWSIHSAIQNIVYDQHEDPESVEVIIDPSKITIELFLRIRDLLNLLQKELDYSWAVLGEVFGRFNESALGLTIRRVRSNIDDNKKFSKQAGFVTEKATFTAADAELLKLFIKPLYGDKPEIAVRELIQNAVDAVRERLIFEPNNTDLENSPAVIVSIHKVEDSKWMLRVEDKGIGMSLNTIIGYFLNAGASFRLSTIWKEKFIDEKGKAKVLRSGRFGVGALAAFMLAEDPTQIEMKVTTRHISSNIDGAYEFTTKLSDTPIQIKYVDKKEPGTVIEIITANPPAFLQESSKENTSENWDWYCLDKPIVERLSLNGKRLQQMVSLPSSLETSKYDYHWIEPKDYESIGWTYSDFPPVVCNGIIVIGNKNSAKYTLADGKFINKEIKMNLPSLSIFDKDGKLPITLDRLRIEYNQLQFLGEIREDVEKNILAFFLTAAPNEYIVNNKNFNEPLLKIHPSLKGHLSKIPWMFSESGTILYCPELLSSSKNKNIVEVADSSLIPYLTSNLPLNLKNPCFAIDVYSIWDDLQSRSLKVIGGSRLKIERQQIDQGKLYNILSLLDNRIAINRENYISLDSINSFLRQKFEYTNLNSFDDILELIERKLQFFRPYLDTDSDDYYFEAMTTIRRRSFSIDVLKRFLYELEDANIATESHSFFQIFNNKRETGNLSKNKNIKAIVANFLGRNHRQYDKELLYSIEREIGHLFDNNFQFDNIEYHRLREDIMHKINRLNQRATNYTDLSFILQEIKNLNQLPPVIDVESFGQADRTLDWIKIKTLDFKRESASFPVAEIVLDNDFKYTSSNNFLAKIWIEYIGYNEIPFDEPSRRELIDKIQTKVNIERHILHWNNALNEEANKRAIK